MITSEEMRLNIVDLPELNVNFFHQIYSICPNVLILIKAFKKVIAAHSEIRFAHRNDENTETRKLLL